MISKDRLKDIIVGRSTIGDLVETVNELVKIVKKGQNMGPGMFQSSGFTLKRKTAGKGGEAAEITLARALVNQDYVSVEHSWFYVHDAVLIAGSWPNTGEPLRVHNTLRIVSRRDYDVLLLYDPTLYYEPGWPERWHALPRLHTDLMFDPCDPSL